MPIEVQTSLVTIIPRGSRSSTLGEKIIITALAHGITNPHGHSHILEYCLTNDSFHPYRYSDLTASPCSNKLTVKAFRAARNTSLPKKFLLSHDDRLLYRPSGERYDHFHSA